MLKVNAETCYGCEACVNICPRQAIKMISSTEGFFYPKIDETKCINCNLCEEVCPDIHKNIEKLKYPNSSNVWAAWNKDQDAVLKSTSGGMFIVLASTFLRKGGVVYGCAWHSDDVLVAEHKRISSLSDLDALRGSKYVKSQVNDTFCLVKNDLLQGLNVLYSGTPCQIGALRLFLCKHFPNLYTIDLVCHGTPSPKVFNAYIKFLETLEKSSVKNFCFRDKKKFGWGAYTSYKTLYSKRMTSVGIDPYACGFYAEFMSQNSCYHCNFSCSNRVGDITLSDFWGGEYIHKELKKQRKFGYNMVMCNTEKGLALFQECKDQVQMIESTLENAQKGDIRLRESKGKPLERLSFYRILDERGFAFMAKTLLRPKYYYLRKFFPIVIKNFCKDLWSSCK